MKRRQKQFEGPNLMNPIAAIYVVTYTLRGHERDVYFREDFGDAAAAEAFIRRIEEGEQGWQEYAVTGFFELRAAS